MVSYSQVYAVVVVVVVGVVAAAVTAAVVVVATAAVRFVSSLVLSREVQRRTKIPTDLGRGKETAIALSPLE